MAERDPFSAPGLSTSGDGDALPHLGEALRRMYFARLVADTAGVPVWRSVHQAVEGGPIITTNIAGPIERLHIHAQRPKPANPEAPSPMARLAWVPRGFVITPRTPTAPNGYGMPPTPDGKGTPGGPLRQVIINRHAGNQYPEAVYANYTAGTIDTANAVAGSLFYEDWELDRSTGFALGTKNNLPELPEERIWTAQFKPLDQPPPRARYTSLLPEPDGPAWLCHRPTYATEDAVTALVRSETNLRRAAVGRAPLQPIIRGWAGELATDAIYQIQYSGTFGHSSPLFRPGHQELTDRLNARGGWTYGAGENLAYGYGAYSLELAMAIVEAWTNSPGHYANMIENWELDGNAFPFMDFASGPALLQRNQLPPYDLNGPTVPFLPPLNTRASVQIFGNPQSWVYASSERDGLLGLDGPNATQDMFIPAYRVSSAPPEEGSEDDPYVTYRGRTLYLNAGPVDGRIWRTVAVGMRTDSVTGQARMREATITRDTPTSQAYLSLFEGRMDDYVATRVLLARYALSTVDASLIGRPRFSASGERMVFSVLRLVDVPTGRIESDFSASGGASGVLGHVIRFVEYRDGQFYDLLEDQLLIEPLSFGSRFHSQRCVGSCRLMADYDGELVVYARIDVAASSAQSTPNGYTKSFTGVLVFPNGSSLPYAETTMNTTSELTGAAAHGVFRHLLPFDIMRPEGIAYVEYRLPADDTQRLTAHLRFQGQEIKTSLDPLNIGVDGRLGYPFGGGYLDRANITTLSVHRGATDAVNFHTRIINAAPPSVPYQGTLVSWGRETAPSAMPRGTTMENDAASIMEYVLLGPVIVGDGVYDPEEGYQRVEFLRRASYQGQHILCGRIESTLGPVGPGAAWQGDDQIYRASSLDLEALTGLSDLSQDITPIGVL